MKTVGLRELKNHLSAYVRHVRAGEAVAVTDRGEVVAELIPPNSLRREVTGLAGLARKGELTLAQDRKRTNPYPSLSRALRGRNVAELLDAERGDR
jgi:prevent-host-death family protein